jgi:Protein of unknown function (DUF4240)
MIHHMAEARFWALVEASGGDPEMLKRLLMRLSKNDIIAFDLALDKAMYQLDREDIHDVTGGSDDGFEYIRLWIVSRGRAYFESVLADPQNAPHDAEVDEENESFGYAAMEAYDEVFGEGVWDGDVGAYRTYSRFTGSNRAAWPSLPGKQ